MDEERKKFFSRQIRIPSFGEVGQEKFFSSSVLVVGLGGLGSPASLHLASAGVGKIGLMDFDRVEFSNLHRQTAFTLSDLGKRKTEVTAEFLRKRIPKLELEIFSFPFSDDLSEDFLKAWDLVLDCTDDIPAKYSINDRCVRDRKPLCTASLYRTSAQFAIFSPEGKPCYRCLYPQLESTDAISCADGGVLGIQTALAGLQQANLAIRYLLDPNSVSVNSLYLMEWESPIIYESKIPPDPACVVCGDSRSSAENRKSLREISVWEYAKNRNDLKYLLVDIREEEERSEYPISDSEHFPLSRLKKGEIPSLPSASIVILICESGMRSLKAVDLLTDRYPNSFSLKGGRRALQSFLSEKN
ncbi:dinucleotide-utilizing protein [Leptospira fletcheri]|uniref:Dinucleotide-utilizing protein n=1 Tax=Leptospira fletcheri TaxID=2484981 RepID=A0A4R9G687_9LEPT|nr:HesA/MoeB/ThiF family protein [Leptospira fletcheri]TGK06267.1 dinucleotide-utilizing protein [Leptospira fletcheri]